MFYFVPDARIVRMSANTGHHEGAVAPRLSHAGIDAFDPLSILEPKLTQADVENVDPRSKLTQAGIAALDSLSILEPKLTQTDIHDVGEPARANVICETGCATTGGKRMWAVISVSPADAI